jgi:hypothetical protein
LHLQSAYKRQVTPRATAKYKLGFCYSAYDLSKLIYTAFIYIITITREE